MKNSGIEWIGEIPDSWKLIPNKHLFINHSSKVGDKWKNYKLLSLTTTGVKEKNINSAGGKVPTSYETYQTVTLGDIVFCLFDLDCSAVFAGLSTSSGMITSAYDVFAPNAEFLDGQFAEYWFSYVFSNRYYKIYSKNIRYAVTSDAFGGILTPVPPLYIQEKIGMILQSRCNEVDKLIEIQQAQIEKLKEYKQSVITEAVTKGIDPNVPMKDSGVEWIGQVPEQWKVKRAKYIATSIFKGNGITKEDIAFDGNTPCVRYGEIYTKYNISFKECKTRTNRGKLSILQFFRYGDILFAGTGELVEEIGKNIVYLGEQECLAGGDIIVLRHKQDPAFLNYALYATCSQMQKSFGKAKLKVVHISASEIGNIFISLPTIKEQRKIADYLDDKCSNIDKLIEIKQAKIEKLQEYKKSLIYEYVTGKKEVV